MWKQEFKALLVRIVDTNKSLKTEWQGDLLH